MPQMMIGRPRYDLDNQAAFTEARFHARAEGWEGERQTLSLCKPGFPRVWISLPVTLFRYNRDMNEALFIQLLDRLTEQDWQAIAGGAALVLIDDRELALGSADAPNVIVRGPRQKPETMASAGSLLDDYYRHHPLSLAGFNRQVEGLIARHGAPAFAAAEGQLPSHTLFVEGGEVVAESSSAPRYRYGTFCELDRSLTDDALEARVRQWLASGEAHERYLSMNVCRYSC